VGCRGAAEEFGSIAYVTGSVEHAHKALLELVAGSAGVRKSEATEQRRDELWRQAVAMVARPRQAHLWWVSGRKVLEVLCWRWVGAETCLVVKV
jgi:hypothetical protein